MIHAVLRYLSTTDGVDLGEYLPVDSTCFRIYLFAEIGPSDSEASEHFYFTVATPRWLQKNIEANTIFVGRHVLFIERFNAQIIREGIRAYCRSCSGEVWHEIAEKVARIGSWEFEDYKKEKPMRGESWGPFAL